MNIADGFRTLGVLAAMTVGCIGACYIIGALARLSFAIFRFVFPPKR